MTEKQSREIAAQAWCAATTRNKIMDVDLASEFAKILHREVEKAEKEAFDKGRESVYRPTVREDWR